MAANLRFSSKSANGKNYLGGAYIQGAEGIYSPNMITTNAVFDKVLKSENIAGTEDYRCLYFVNDFTNQTIYEPTIQITSSQASNAIFHCGLVTDKGVVAQALPDENTEPTGITFNPTTTATGLIKGTKKELAPGEFVAFWFKRKATNSGGSGTITGEMQFRIQFKM